MRPFRALIYLFFALTISFSPIHSTLEDEKNVPIPSMLDENVELMNAQFSKSSGMDILIISSNSPVLSTYWEKRLEQSRPYLLNPDTLVICVDEDWGGIGAGNGLGTLYAYQKACLKAKERLGIDLIKAQAEGAAIAMYHTAGQGKRLAPLTFSEFGVKSAVKLPGLIHSISSDNLHPMLMTLLEATIKQTAIYAPSRKGRLSVFWSDQVFIPSKSCVYIPKSHIDLLVKKIPVPTEENWKLQNLDNYGIVGWDATGDAKLFDKCNYSTFSGIVAANKAISEQGLGISMGAFSLSWPMTVALLKEFESEMAEKQVLLDSDPYFWMPLTLDLETYFTAMEARQVSPKFIKEHYERMQKFRKQFEENNEPYHLALFSAVDIGSESFWWDYGTVAAYYNNNIMMTQTGKEAEVMRRFYHMTLSGLNNSTENLHVENSLCLDCNIKKGSIKNSILIGQITDEIDSTGCIMIDSYANSLKAENSIAYYIFEDKPAVTLNPSSVRADLLIPEYQHLELYSPINYDAKTYWKVKLPPNEYTWEEVADLVSPVHILEKAN